MSKIPGIHSNSMLVFLLKVSVMVLGGMILLYLLLGTEVYSELTSSEEDHLGYQYRLESAYKQMRSNSRLDVVLIGARIALLLIWSVWVYHILQNINRLGHVSRWRSGFALFSGWVPLFNMVAPLMLMMDATEGLSHLGNPEIRRNGEAPREEKALKQLLLAWWILLWFSVSIGPFAGIYWSESPGPSAFHGFLAISFIGWILQLVALGLFYHCVQRLRKLEVKVFQMNEAGEITADQEAEDVWNLNS